MEIKPEIVVAHYVGKGGFYNKLIRFWTRSQCTHTEIIVNGNWLSSSIGKGVHYEPRTYDKSEWEFHVVKEIDLTKRQLNEFTIWAESIVGNKYDNTGIIFSQILPFGLHRSNRWFCSEVSTKGLQLLTVGETFNLKPQKISPAKLYKLFPTNTNTY